MDLLALCVLSVLDSDGVLSEEGATTRAELVATACADKGDKAVECVHVLPVLWKLETASTFSLTPGGKGSCGVGQVVPTKNTPTCAEMKVPSVGLQAAWYVWGVKRRAVRGFEMAFRAYNGNPKRRDGYGARGVRFYKKAVKKCQSLVNQQQSDR
jgi:hypothetical protein